MIVLLAGYLNTPKPKSYISGGSQFSTQWGGGELKEDIIFSKNISV